jgi:hypothetical protein
MKMNKRFTLWIVVIIVNPDGGEYDHATGSYVSWRRR